MWWRLKGEGGSKEPEKPTPSELIKLRSVANYQFGKGVGEALFPSDVTVVRSKKTGRVKYIYHEGRLLATLRPKDGLLALTLHGAERILSARGARLKVKVSKEAAKHAAEGKNVFAKHVVEADQGVRPQDDVMVLDEKGALVAVGRAVLSGEEMKAFGRGVAIKVRKGVKEL